MDLKDFKVLMKNLEKQLVIDENNLSEISAKLPLLYHEYLNDFSRELRKLKQLQAKKSQQYGILYDKLKFNSGKSWDSNKEIDSQIHADQSYYDLCVEYSEQEVIVNQLEKCLYNINGVQYNIKNIIAHRQLFGI